jgi:NAD(P)-dependent dehydrogenase (short-subunit alcohol dehydrogenase family)
MRGVLITGGAKRIGSEVCRLMAARGWHVLVHYFRSAGPAQALVAELQATGARADMIQADLRDVEACETLVPRALALCPGLQALVNNASEFDYDDPATATPARLTSKFAANALAPITLCQGFARTVPGEGTIVNILDNRVFAPNPDYFSYSVSKSALWGATRMLAQALAPRIRVNAVAPGITLVSGEQSAENFERTRRLSPLGVNSTPDQVARAVELLISARSACGTLITLDGGEALAPHGRDVAFVPAEGA